MIDQHFTVITAFHVFDVVPLHRWHRFVDTETEARALVEADAKRDDTYWSGCPELALVLPGDA